MTLLLLVGAFLSVAASTAAPTAADGSAPASTITVVPAARYRAGWFKRLLLGGHWRDAWNTPIEAPVVSLETFDGGLLPQRQGGGGQTSTLHFKSAAGRTWVFRSMDKDPTPTLDPDTAEGWIGDLTQDMTCTAHPGVPLIVAALLEAVGVLHATPQLAMLPDDARLGEFRAQFAGMLGTLEERIEHRIPGVDKAEDTLSLFERLDRRSDERVDARDYLRSRLVDILVGDWDRHTGQYRWVRVTEGDERVWRVVPRDHDQAFTRYDGAFPSIIEYYQQGVVGWGDTYPPIEKITFRGQYTDRRFLVPLERAEWEEVTGQVVGRLTDAVIEDAVHRLPPSMYAQAGEGLARALRSRRDRLAEASREYYRLLARDVDVRGTTKAEDFQVDRGADGSVSVAVFARDDESGERAATPHFHRTFRPEETSEIRLYTMGGRDRVVEQGNGTGAILLRIIEPPGTAEIVDRSPQGSATKIYAPAAPAELPPDVLARRKERDPRFEDRMRYEVFRDWGSDLLFIPQLSYDSTRGLLFGAYGWRTSYGFGLDPLASDQKFGAAWSTSLSRPRIEYGGNFRTRIHLRGLLYFAYSGIEQAKFFGFGNETVRNSSLSSNGFYDARQDRIVVNPMVEAAVIGGLRARVGAEFKHVSSVDQTGPIGQLRPSGAGGMSVGSAQAGLVFAPQQRNVPSHPVCFRRCAGERRAGHLRQPRDIRESAGLCFRSVRRARPDERAAQRGSVRRAQLRHISVLRGGLRRRYAGEIGVGRHRRHERTSAARVRSEPIRRRRRAGREHGIERRNRQVHGVPAVALRCIRALRRRARVRRRRKLVEVAHRGRRRRLVRVVCVRAVFPAHRLAQGRGGPVGRGDIVLRRQRVSPMNPFTGRLPSLRLPTSDRGDDVGCARRRCRKSAPLPWVFLTAQTRRVRDTTDR